MLPEFPTAARISEFIIDLEYLFSRLTIGRFAHTAPHLWLVSKIPPKTQDDCRSTPDKKSRTHDYGSLVELLIELPHMSHNCTARNCFFLGVFRCSA